MFGHSQVEADGDILFIKLLALVKLVKFGRIREAGYVARTGREDGVYKISEEKSALKT